VASIFDIFSSIHGYTARNIVKKVAAEWSDYGVKQRSGLETRLKRLKWRIRHENHAVKKTQNASKFLEEVFSKEGIYGNISTSRSNLIIFEIISPILINDSLFFDLIKGSIDKKSGDYQLSESHAVRISWHSLQRLFGKNNSFSSHQALEEIASCLSLAREWNVAGNASGALCWPVLTKNGFFVAVPSHESDQESIFVTWMKGVGLSRKWGIVFENLRMVEEKQPAQLMNRLFIKEFIGSFPWMLREHIPGIDVLGEAWDRREFSPDSELFSEKLIENEIEKNDRNLDVLSNSSLPEGKLSTSYVPGLNYRDTPPPFKIHSRHKGLIVQKWHTGSVVISLRNSWYGRIPDISLNREKALGINTESLTVGDEISVEVKKIIFIKSQSAFAVSLDRCSLIDSIWDEIEKKYPVDTEISGRIVGVYKNYCRVILHDGVKGSVPLISVCWFFNDDFALHESYIGRHLDLIVTGFNIDTRNIQFDVRAYHMTIPSLISENFLIGQKVTCKVIGSNNDHILLWVEPGVYAILYQINCWDRPLPSDGDSIDANIIHIDLADKRIFLGLDPPVGVEAICQSIVPSESLWDDFVDKYSDGDTVQAQVMMFLKSYYVLATSYGVSGILRLTEVTWSTDKDDQRTEIEIGQVIDVKILKINYKNKHIEFSRRRLVLHPLEDPVVLDILEYEMDGKVISIVEYGYFIRLPFKFVGLLHRDCVPKTYNLVEGDQVKVTMKEMNAERKRLQLSISCNDPQVQ
jgi:ribosomal protein S1